MKQIIVIATIVGLIILSYTIGEQQGYERGLVWADGLLSKALMQCIVTLDKTMEQL